MKVAKKGHVGAMTTHDDPNIRQGEEHKPGAPAPRPPVNTSDKPPTKPNPDQPAQRQPDR